MTQQPAPIRKHDQTPEEWREGVRRERRKVAPLAWIACAGILALILVYVLFFFLWVEAPAEAWVKIPEGAKGKNVEDTLTKYFGNDYADKVMALLAVDEDADVRPGAYHVQKGQTVFNVAKRIRNNRQDPMRYSINHSRTLDGLASSLGNRLGVGTAQMKSALTDPAMLKKRNLTPEQAIALYFEDTYEDYWSPAPDKVAAKLSEHYDKVWTPERLAKAKDLGLTPAQVITICSIVDEETNDNNEKGRIGRLYMNRLATDMKLQADPTVKFAIGDFSIRRITNDMLSTDSPYNTYKYKGLPPGPIRTTSVRTLDAVLNAPQSNDLYMCAKEDFSGSHNFAADYETHKANARRYQHALDERNIH